MVAWLPLRRRTGPRHAADHELIEVVWRRLTDEITRDVSLSIIERRVEC